MFVYLPCEPVELLRGGEFKQVFQTLIRHKMQKKYLKVPNMKKFSLVKVTSRIFVNFLLLQKNYSAGSKPVILSCDVTAEHSLNNLPLKAVKALIVFGHNSLSEDNKYI